MKAHLSRDGISADADLLQRARDLGPLIAPYVEEEENNRRLSPKVVGALKEAGFYKLYLPKTLGGLETDPLTTAQLVEEVARQNTAAGWSMMVANTTLFLGGFLEERAVDEIFGNGSDVFIAGSIHPPMRAAAVRDGYIISGRNPLLSNIHEADWVTVTALIMEDGKPALADGHPQIIVAMMKANDLQVIDTWNPLGMRATDSNDIEAKEIFVPRHLAFPLMPGVPTGRHFQGPLYRFPAAGANIACLLAPVSLAVAHNAILELKSIAGRKTPLGSMVPIRDRGVVQSKLAKAEALVQAGRTFLYDRLSSCWKKTLNGEPISLEEKAGLLLASAHTNQSCVQAVELVYTAAGTTGVYMKNKLAHYFTDAQVLRQHGFMNESRYETAGQVFLGLPPDLPLIEF